MNEQVTSLIIYLRRSDAGVETQPSKYGLDLMYWKNKSSIARGLLAPEDTNKGDGVTDDGVDVWWEKERR